MSSSPSFSPAAIASHQYLQAAALIAVGIDCQERTDDQHRAGPELERLFGDCGQQVHRQGLDCVAPLPAIHLHGKLGAAAFDDSHAIGFGRFLQVGCIAATVQRMPSQGCSSDPGSWSSRSITDFSASVCVLSAATW